VRHSVRPGRRVYGVAFLPWPRHAGRRGACMQAGGPLVLRAARADFARSRASFHRSGWTWAWAHTVAAYLSARAGHVPTWLLWLWALAHGSISPRCKRLSVLCVRQYVVCYVYVLYAVVYSSSLQ
jgi:hypothetical protein